MKSKKVVSREENLRAIKIEILFDVRFLENLGLQNLWLPKGVLTQMRQAYYFRSYDDMDAYFAARPSGDNRPHPLLLKTVGDLLDHPDFCAVRKPYNERQGWGPGMERIFCNLIEQLGLPRPKGRMKLAIEEEELREVKAALKSVLK